MYFTRYDFPKNYFAEKFRIDNLRTKDFIVD